LRSDWQGSTIVTLHNLSDNDVSVRVPLSDAESTVELVPMLGGSDDLSQLIPGALITLGPYGYLWLKPDRERR
jgi:maltose alpha-D-glucosyltransferase / alpha-amylase